MTAGTNLARVGQIAALLGLMRPTMDPRDCIARARTVLHPERRASERAVVASVAATLEGALASPHVAPEARTRIAERLRAATVLIETIDALGAT